MDAPERAVANAVISGADSIWQATTEPEIIERLAQSRGAIGWGSVSAFLLQDWRIVSHAHVGTSRPQIATLMDIETSPQRRRERFGAPFARFRIGASYFVPARDARAMATEYPVVPGRVRGQGPDGWDPLDVAYTPIVVNGADAFDAESVLGYIALDDPGSGRRPTESDFAPIEFLARTAGRAIESVRQRLAALGSSRYIEQRNRVLEQIARGLPFVETLESLARLAESVCPGMRCSIYQSDASGSRLEHRCSPSIPELASAAASVPIGVGVVCCGETAATGRSVVARDIEDHPNWDSPYRDLARSLSIRACWSTPILSSGGRVLGTLAMYYDQPHEPTPYELEIVRTVAHAAGVATERELSERAFETSQEQLRQAQRLDAAGRLATGVAHDYNNLLMVIEAHVGVLRERLGGDEGAQGSLREIETAAGHARNIAHALLTFTQRMPSNKRRLRLGEAIHDAVRLLERAMPARIALETDTDTDVWITADPTQIQQIIVNLTLNARDAMPEGGTLTIGSGVEGGSALLTICDAGVGMSAEVRQRAFEPFFTTKPPDRGAGLGLSIVHGIVQDHGGSIDVVSRTGEGTRIEVRLPMASADAATIEVKPIAAALDARDRGACLLVEDNSQVRAVIGSMLWSIGFTPIPVASLAQATRAMLENAEERALLVIDVDLPDGSGLDLLARWRESGVTVPAVIISGAAIEATDSLPRDATLLRKPFDAATLDRAASAVLKQFG